MVGKYFNCARYCVIIDLMSGDKPSRAGNSLLATATELLMGGGRGEGGVCERDSLGPIDNL